MKTLIYCFLSCGFFYFIFSFYNRTWNPMEFSQDSIYFFGCAMFISCLGFCMMAYLDGSNAYYREQEKYWKHKNKVW